MTLLIMMFLVTELGCAEYGMVWYQCSVSSNALIRCGLSMPQMRTGMPGSLEVLSLPSPKAPPHSSHALLAAKWLTEVTSTTVPTVVSSRKTSASLTTVLFSTGRFLRHSPGRRPPWPGGFYREGFASPLL